MCFVTLICNNLIWFDFFSVDTKLSLQWLHMSLISNIIMCYSIPEDNHYTLHFSNVQIRLFLQGFFPAKSVISIILSWQVVFLSVINWFLLLQICSIKHLLYMMMHDDKIAKMPNCHFSFLLHVLVCYVRIIKMNIIKSSEIYIANNGARQVFFFLKKVRIYKMFLKVKI